MTWFPSRSSPVPAGGVVLLNTLSPVQTHETHDYEDIAKYAESAPLPPQRRPLKSDAEVISVDRNPAYITTTQGQRSEAVGVVGSEYGEISSEARGQRSTDVGPEYDNVCSEGKTQGQSTNGVSEYEVLN